MKLPLASVAERNAVSRIATVLSACPHVRHATLFGSRVRGDFTGSSDLDLLIVVDEAEDSTPAIQAMHDIELDFDVPLSPTIMTKGEYEANRRLGSAFLRNVEREGIRLYDAERR